MELYSSQGDLAAPSPSMQLCTVIDSQKAPNNLWYRLHVYIYGLRVYREKVDAEARLQQIVDASYIRTPYFQPGEVDVLKATVMDGEETLAEVIEETLYGRLDRRVKKRVDSGDHRVCAAHGLAPIFEKTFNVKPRELPNDGAFVALTESSGLNLGVGEAWAGLERRKIRGLQPKNPK